MTDRPIIFSGAMVRALLAGTKTQTRRLASSPLRRCEVGDRLWVRETVHAEELSRPPTKRPATAAERRASGRTEVMVLDDLDGTDGLRYAADDLWTRIENTREAGDAWLAAFHYGCRGGARPAGMIGKGIPSIHMPRWSSRLTLVVEAVRFEPLQSISQGDAIAEGIEREGAGWKSYETCPDGTPHPHAIVPNRSPITSYRELWSSLHRAEGQLWEDNPDVLVLTFRVERGNIDRLPA